ncbi:MAG: ABC transporter substrate-binding protein [Halosimplex sp.]
MSADTGLGRSRGGSVELAHFWAEGDGAEMLAAVLEQFRSRHPEVDVSDRMYDNHGMAIKSRMLREDPPPVFVEWPGDNLRPYHEAGGVRPVTDLWEENGWTRSFIDGPRGWAQLGGEFVGIPVDIHRMNNLFYRVDLAEEHGVDPRRIDDPRELLEVMEQVETDAHIGMHQPMKNPSTVLQLWSMCVIGQFGSETYRAITDGDATAHRSEIREAVELVDAFSALASDDAAFIDMVEANQRFIDGGSVFYHQGDWMAGMYEEEPDFEYGRDWDRVNFPGTDGAYVLGMDLLVAAAGVEFTDATRTFLEFMASPDALETLNRIKGSIPPRSDVSLDAFPPMLREQFEDFQSASHFPAGHALEVSPETFVNAKIAMSEFIAQRDVEATTEALVDAY